MVPRLSVLDKAAVVETTQRYKTEKEIVCSFDEHAGAGHLKKKLENYNN